MKDKIKEKAQLYFELSDTANINVKDFNKIISLFAEDASIISGLSENVNGKEEIIQFFKQFFTRNKELKHFFNVHFKNEQVYVDWAVAGRNIEGNVFSLQGRDDFEFDSNNKIKKLIVNIT
ncbi:MAG: nuclear transport factor 2 family protein [Streptococcaceae bacterium]|jgi:nuclear transport factor 2 (NTF2) superfamily protein|nr:nuclear transport factor 2 family protein [Streptococcaceae bacterium]MCL2681728.1 nuclear transport factor 2 family protein [Streptococcaceae bacterium]MCL2858592.1 nuclear transport factor 2 family protein [Streptococcaceae bacterium]